MKKRISCFDIDGTLAKGMLFIPLMESEHQNGHLSGESFQSIQELLGKYKSGEIDYEDAVQQLVEAHAKGLAGKSYEEVRTHAETFLLSNEHNLFHEFGRVAIELLSADQKLFVVTAEPQYLADAVASLYGMDGYISTEYGVEYDLFTGTVTKSLAHRSAKRETLEQYDVAYAFGDSEGDIDMLAQAERPFCISPTPGLRDEAEKRKWSIYDGNDTEAIVNSIAQMRRT
jgi:HAD superfamily phosphoserine phosphatase-like hydrolase